MTELSPQSDVRARIEARPLPDGEAPWSIATDDDAYEAAAESLAHAFLVLVDEKPDLIANDDPFAPELWAAFKERWPTGNDWLGGVTGFQVGWAHNLVRWLHDVPETGNPAIVEIEVPDA